jgi:hypothetical protein
MSPFVTRSIRMFFGLTLIFSLGDRTVHAQTAQPTDTPAEAVPSLKPSNSSTETPAEAAPIPSQPSESPVETPSDQTPAKEKPPRKLKNFIGVGGNIGVSGSETGLSKGAAALITRKDLNDSLSIRGVTTLFGGKRSDSTLALTVNLPIRSKSEKVLLVPFAGGGALISSKGFFDDVIVRGLVTGGVDIPISRRISATTSVNVGFADEHQVGVQIGIGFNF